MTSDDLDLREGHLRLRTMLRYVTDPNHVDSLVAYAYILGILRRKGIKWKCQTFCVWPDLWRHRWPRSQIFQLHLKDLVQDSPLPVDFFRHVYWLPRAGSKFSLLRVCKNYSTWFEYLVPFLLMRSLMVDLFGLFFVVELFLWCKKGLGRCWQCCGRS